jgi:hypothetical protein
MGFGGRSRGSSNGRTAAFEAVYLGSNPSPRAMDKKVVMLGMVFGSVAGGYLPTFFGVGAFSFTSVFCGFLGGIVGIWFSYKLIR